MFDTIKLKVSRGLDRLARLAHGTEIGLKYPLLKNGYLSMRDFFFRPRKVKIHDQWLFIHRYDRLGVSYPILSRGIFEDFESKLFLSCVEEGAVVLDIGANIGYYTLLAAKKVGPQGRVYALEPDRDNFTLLEKSVAANGYSNVSLLQCAASDRDGFLDLYLSTENKGDHRTYKTSDDRKDRISYSVEAVTVDSIFSGSARHPSIVKMDIQGFEHFALSGMTTLINQTSRILLLTEFWPYALVSSGMDSAGRYYQELMELGFDVFDIDEKEKALFRVSDINKLLSTLSSKDAFTNLLCAKGSWPQLEGFLRC